MPRSLLSVLKVLPDILPAFVPYTLVLAAFMAFVVWNGGIVLGKIYSFNIWLATIRYDSQTFFFASFFQGDKSNHIPVLHIPQLYYFIASTTFFGWPILISTPDGILGLTRSVWSCMFGNRT